jgi:hypothetical protein
MSMRSDFCRHAEAIDPVKRGSDQFIPTSYHHAWAVIWMHAKLGRILAVAVTTALAQCRAKPPETDPLC